MDEINSSYLFWAVWNANNVIENWNKLLVMWKKRDNGRNREEQLSVQFDSNSLLTNIKMNAIVSFFRGKTKTISHFFVGMVGFDVYIMIAFDFSESCFP